MAHAARPARLNPAPRLRSGLGAATRHGFRLGTIGTYLLLMVAVSVVAYLVGPVGSAVAVLVSAALTWAAAQALYRDPGLRIARHIVGGGAVRRGGRARGRRPDGPRQPAARADAGGSQGTMRSRAEIVPFLEAYSANMSPTAVLTGHSQGAWMVWEADLARGGRAGVEVVQRAADRVSGRPGIPTHLPGAERVFP